MSFSAMQPNILDRYLKLLGLPQREPSLEALTELVQAHLFRIPFENISKLYYKNKLGLHGIPALEQYLDGIERYHFGGTCYSNNFHLYQLLSALGYQVILCGADMSQPDVHMVSIVTLNKHAYLVDVGYGAPFPAPMRRDLAVDTVIELGHDRYVLKPQDERGFSRMEMYWDGALTHGYTVKPIPRQIDYFDQVIAASFRPEATFMNALLVARFFPNRSTVVHNLALVETYSAESSARPLANLDELARVVQENFEIPAEVTLEALKGLGELGNVWN